MQVDRNTDALEQLYRDRYRTFRDVLVGVVGRHDLAREVVQEAFARAPRERRKFRGDGSLEAWVWRIALNVALKVRRDLRRQWELNESAPAAREVAADHDLRAAVRALPPRRRLVVFLRYFADSDGCTAHGVCAGIAGLEVGSGLGRAAGVSPISPSCAVDDARAAGERRI